MRTDSRPVPLPLFSLYISITYPVFAPFCPQKCPQKIGVVTGNRKVTAFFYLLGKRLCIVNKRISR